MQKFQVKETFGPKGLSAIATENIPQGQQILVELPLMIVRTSPESVRVTEHQQANDLFAHIEANHPDVLIQFRKLHDSCTPRTDTSTYFTNRTSLGIDPEGRPTQGIYTAYSRINHSCTPNAMVPLVDDQEHCCLTLLAARDVYKGDEITISYIAQDAYPLTRSRQLELKHWRFECDCPIYTGTHHGSSEARRRQIRLLKSRLTRYLKTHNASAGIFRDAKHFQELVDVELSGCSVDWRTGEVPPFVDERVREA